MHNDVYILNRSIIDKINLIEKIKRLDQAYFLLHEEGDYHLVENDDSRCWPDYNNIIAFIPPLKKNFLGSSEFQKTYKCKYSHYVGAMANGISSANMIIELGRNDMLGSFGSGGLQLSVIEEAILKIKNMIEGKPYIFNLLYNPKDPKMERETVDLYIKHGITQIEAAAYMLITPFLAYYRVKGLRKNEKGEVIIKNRIIAKISRRETAEIFLNPPPLKLLTSLLSDALISEEEFNLSQRIPMADDITVEGDSAGHTDNRLLLSMFPSIYLLRNEYMNKYKYAIDIRIGAAGGISTPYAAIAAYSMGADYIVTGSINQTCVESGASLYTKKLLSQVSDTDITMAPAADMFEQGVKLQVLKKATFFPIRAQKLYVIYSNYNSIDDIPDKDREDLEKNIFRKTLEQVWSETCAFFQQVNPTVIVEAMNNPKKKMSLIFRWYLGLSSRWSNQGVQGREMDYQIWCGPSIGAFNSWVKDSFLENLDNRRVALVNEQIINGAAYLSRLRNLNQSGFKIPNSAYYFHPEVLPVL
ncbi:MAG: PfaD family polyunsaturated fatty acid/polyketide biosynthesis protein [Dysgonomonas sp.]